jgi:hypothetical protein
MAAIRIHCQIDWRAPTPDDNVAAFPDEFLLQKFADQPLQCDATNVEKR